MTNALESSHLGKRYGRTWALRECSLALPTGRVAALVGPNGAGKTTLLQLAVGLLRPSAGQVRVFGRDPRVRPLEVLTRVGFVAQDAPLYRSFTVRDLLAYGRHMNSLWDQQGALDRLAALGIPLDRAAGRLSGGQQAQVALALALAKRPDLVVLDEPLASLDPLARREFLRVLMQAATQDGLSVVLSSHILSDLERVCDYLIILSAARVQLVGEIEAIVAAHKRLIGPRQDPAAVASHHQVIEERHTDQQTLLLIRRNGQVFDPSWKVQDVSLEDIVLAYLSQARDDSTGTAVGAAAREGELR
ncbi:MAG TPA: ABC transporter ATP-binding protein [Ktedonobacterales bacterium]|nr:ABC transporter ATP-binding protein [Ktedonobacterales bacterium]